MFDARIDAVDRALAASPPDDRPLLWQWACREMLHDTLTGMHCLSDMLGIAERVADGWHAPMDVCGEPARPYIARAALADTRLSQVREGLGRAGDDDDRTRLWQQRYASLIAATVHGMQTLAGKHRIQASAPIQA